MFNRLLAAAAVFGLAALASPLSATVPALPSTDQAIAHVLNRLTFGPRPGDVERLRREGLELWIDRQLTPSRIDDSGMTERLSRLSTLGLDSQALAREIHQPARRERQRAARSPSTAPEASASTPSGTDPSTVLGTGPSASLRASRSEGNETIRRDRQIITDLSEAKILRAIYSERQLEELLVDFWFNHFNVFAAKGPTRVWIGEFEREAIRPNVLGNFRTMLEAVAKSPAMLFYLDNWMNVRLRSVDSDRATARQVQQARRRLPPDSDPPSAKPPARRATGLNENYARELLELHTLGVDGGYTQQDVVDVARAFTGWTLRFAEGQIQPRSGQDLRLGGGRHFSFDPRLHGEGEKTVLGHTIKAGGGIEDGRQVLDILAAHPSTARFIAEKLARRFVSDEPPADLVKRAAATFTATRGDLRETLRAIITSPQFFAPEAYRAKVKTPFEFVVSAFRASSTDVRVALPIVRELRELGMPLYLCQPPTGYDDTAATWVSSGALVSRMNFAVAVAGGRYGSLNTHVEAVMLGSPEFQRR
jgi:uncharacterized protein (DUF1800 family)